MWTSREILPKALPLNSSMSKEEYRAAFKEIFAASSEDAERTRAKTSREVFPQYANLDINDDAVIQKAVDELRERVGLFTTSDELAETVAGGGVIPVKDDVKEVADRYEGGPLRDPLVELDIERVPAEFRDMLIEHELAEMLFEMNGLNRDDAHSRALIFEYRKAFELPDPYAFQEYVRSTYHEQLERTPEWTDIITHRLREREKVFKRFKQEHKDRSNR